MIIKQYLARKKVFKAKNMNYGLRFLVLLFFTVVAQKLVSQTTVSISGTIYDSTGYSIGFATISIQPININVVADKFGNYQLKVPSGQYTIIVSCIGYNTLTKNIEIKEGSKLQLDFTLQEHISQVEEVKVINRSDNLGVLQRVNTQSLSLLPNTTGNIENIIKRLPGVASNNELSSQYSVRGGSFDENMIYVNNIEIYKPTLIRSGQQEGLSFVNPDLVSSIKFSAGGFDATYGDKMSSVLDVTYKQPTHNTGSISLSFLGVNFHYEGTSKNSRFKHLTGIRHKTTQYLLAGLDAKGEYRPVFQDFQTLLSYNISSNFEINFLGYIAQNIYNFVPTTREIEFGTFQLPLRAQIFYEGQEKDKYLNTLSSLTLNFRPTQNTLLKVISTAYYNNEAETFDLLGEYNISQIDYNNRDSVDKIGVGGFQNRARNFLNTNIQNLQFLAFHQINNNKIRYGITYQWEKTNDRLKEWEIIDSAGYLYPYHEKEIVPLVLRNASNSISSYRIMGYIQYVRDIQIHNEFVQIQAGIRSHYWNYNGENVISPRFSVSYRPSWQNRLLLYTAAGYYAQPPSYKEMRKPSGDVNPSIRAQYAINYLIGSDYIFYAWAHPFKLTIEAYYKKLKNLIPYRIDNVRSIYAGENLSHGYARGFDIKLNGEFIKGTESWFSLSILDTKEDILNDQYSLSSKPDSFIYPGYFPRPTDQTMNLNIFFQDYIPRYPSYKVYLSIHYGSALPVTFPLSNRWHEVQKLLPSYKRVDLGVSKIIKSENTHSKLAIFNSFKEIWFSAEIFNVIGVNNTASFMWIKTFAEQKGIPGYFAVPNYLTPRRLNIKLTASF